MRVIKVKDWNEIPKNYTGIIEHTDGVKVWYFNGKRHRENGPAYEGHDGSKAWFLNGKLHREDGPAIERDAKGWWLNGIYLFGLLPESQPFILIEEFVDEEGKERIKVLTQEAIEIWPNLPCLKELAENWKEKE